MASDEGYAEKGLLSPDSSEEESFDSNNKNPIFIKTSSNNGFLRAACYILLGMVISFLTLTASTRLQTKYLEPVSLDLGLLPPLEPNAHAEENGYWCGQSPQEARSKGCQFDIVLYSWVPPLCYDDQIQKAYMEQRESEWYLEKDIGQGSKMAPEIVAKGEVQELWLPWEYHRYHCQFIFKMMTRILRNSSMGIPGRLLQYYHTDHCINALLGTEKTPTVDVSTLVSLNYSTCYSRA
jgi:hypothetical protein